MDEETKAIYKFLCGLVAEKLSLPPASPHVRILASVLLDIIQPLSDFMHERHGRISLHVHEHNRQPRIAIAAETSKISTPRHLDDD